MKIKMKLTIYKSAPVILVNPVRILNSFELAPAFMELFIRPL